MSNQSSILRRSLIAIYFVLIGIPVFSQKQKLTGTITTVNGERLAGVSIIQKGTFNGTISDFDGNFTFLVEGKSSILHISSIGYESQDISVGGSSHLDVIMKEQVLEPEKVMSVGYGTMKQGDLTGAFSFVKMDQLPTKPANSVERLLQGQLAGVQVTTSSDDPGAGVDIRVRGASSLNGSVSPLVVVDGFPLGEAGGMSQISPSDIESIQVLKDASATAIYGSKGANGVIFITKKKGSGNSTQVTFSQQTTFSDFTSELDMWIDPVLMAELSNESRRNAGLPMLYIGSKDPSGVYYPSVREISDGTWGHSTAWDDIVFRMPVSNSTNLAIRTQREKTQFSLSTSYFTDEGVYIDDDYSTLNVNMDIIQTIYDNLIVGGNVMISSDDRNNNGGLAYWRNPLLPVYENNDPSQGYYLAGTKDYSHPLAITAGKSHTNESLNVITSGFLEADLFSGLKVKSQLNYHYKRNVEEFYNPSKYTEDGDMNNGHGGIRNQDYSSLLTETYLSYNKSFNGKHVVRAMLGYSYEHKQTQYSNLDAYDFSNESLGSGNLATGAPEKQSLSNWATEQVMYSVYGRLNYAYINKYLATVTMREDGSSKFGENNRWAYFPSAALGWKLHNENFIKNLGIFDELKLRGSYGVSGNQGINPYLTHGRYGRGKYYVNGEWQTAIGPGYMTVLDEQTGKKLWGGISNADLKWETTHQFNIGADLTFLNRRLHVTADYYNKYTTDLLRERLLSPSSAYDKMWVNDGELENKGFEFNVTGDIIDTKDWDFTATVMFSCNRNKVKDLGNAAMSGLHTDSNTGMQYEFYGNTLESYRQAPNILGIDEAVGIFYGYKTDGIVQSHEEGLAAGLEGDMALPGEFKYVDINENGKIDINDRTVIGDPNPDFIASSNLYVRYKKWDISILFNGVFGQDILNTKAFDSPSSQPLRWTYDNPTNKYPSLRDERQVLLSDAFVEDGSYLRLQNLSIGYNMDSFGSSWFKGGRIYMNATNLFTITNFDGYDPEVATDGIYWGGYPKLRRWTMGLELTF